MFKTLAVFVTICVTSVTAAAAAGVPQTGALRFDVIRKGKDIGDYTIRFAPKGGNLTVRLKTDVAVKILGVSAYVFTQDSTESWKNGKLASLHSVTNDNGTAHDISVGATSILPASLWNSETATTSRLINTIDGRKMSVRVQRLGNENVSTGHGKVPATHYRISGDLARDLWYGADGSLVKVAFAGDDGSRVEYRLR